MNKIVTTLSPEFDRQYCRRNRGKDHRSQSGRLSAQGQQEVGGAAAREPRRQDDLSGRLPVRRLDRAAQAGAGLVRRAHAEREDARSSRCRRHYQHDDPKTWDEIKANGDAAIVGVGHCSTCAPRCRHPRHHARDQIRRADGRAPYRQVRHAWCVGDQGGGLPEAPRAFVPQPVMGKIARTSCKAYV